MARQVGNIYGTMAVGVKEVCNFDFMVCPNLLYSIHTSFSMEPFRQLCLYNDQFGHVNVDDTFI